MSGKAPVFTHARIICALVMLLGGCASERDFYEQAAKTNIAVEESHNRILFLNAIRAMKREPMHFTGFSKITGPAGMLTPSLAFQIPFGPDAANNLLQPSFKPDVASYELAIFDKQEFMRGFTQRIQESTLQYYLDQGWPAEMVLHLFVRTIEYYDATTGTRTVITNRPGDPDSFKDFQKFVHDAALCRMTFTSGKASEHDVENVPLNEGSLPNAQWLLAMQEKGYTFKKDPQKPGEYKISKKEAPRVLEFSDTPLSPALCPDYLKKSTAPPGPPAQDSSASPPAPSASASGKPPAAEMRMMVLGGSTDSSKADKAPSAMHLRSPEGVVYYLGELARAQLVRTLQDGQLRGPGPVVTVTIDYHKIDKEHPCSAPTDEQRGGKCPVKVPLFNVVSRPLLRDGDVKLFVVHDGVPYGIPKEEREAGRSMHALSLITQIINLHKDSKELPQSTTVRIIQ